MGLIRLISGSRRVEDAAADADQQDSGMELLANALRIIVGSCFAVDVIALGVFSGHSAHSRIAQTLSISR